jgi:DNA-binding transcriptional regulator LsrR (DeoR family)
VEKYSRDFKGVWIPKEIWLSDKLSLMEKVLFVEIHSLDNERGCFASNRHFSEFFGISERQIRNHVSSLKTKGFVKITIANRNQRVIRTAGKFARVPDEAIRAMHKMQRELVEKFSLNASRQVGRKFPGR